MKHLRHHNVAAWKYADELFFAVHRMIVQGFPRSERYELSSQLRRAALSVPANIAEGFAYATQGERRQFLRTAWASLVEADYYLSIADRLNYLDEAGRNELERLTKLTASALSGLLATLPPKRGTGAPWVLSREAALARGEAEGLAGAKRRPTPEGPISSPPSPACSASTSPRR